MKPSPILDEDLGQTKVIVEFINKKTLSNGNPVRLVSECSRFVYLFIYLFIYLIAFTMITMLKKTREKKFI